MLMFLMLETIGRKVDASDVKNYQTEGGIFLVDFGSPYNFGVSSEFG